MVHLSVLVKAMIHETMIVQNAMTGSNPFSVVETVAEYENENETCSETSNENALDDDSLSENFGNETLRMTSTEIEILWLKPTVKQKIEQTFS